MAWERGYYYRVRKEGEEKMPEEPSARFFA
jgi:hypothetical protein